MRLTTTAVLTLAILVAPAWPPLSRADDAHHPGQGATPAQQPAGVAAATQAPAQAQPAAPGAGARAAPSAPAQPPQTSIPESSERQQSGGMMTCPMMPGSTAGQSGTANCPMMPGQYGGATQGQGTGPGMMHGPGMGPGMMMPQAPGASPPDRIPGETRR